MSTRQAGLAFAVWGLRLAALGTLALWVIPTRQYEATENAERTYFGLGWPDHWLASEVTLRFRPTVRRDGTWSYDYKRRGPLTAWGSEPRSAGIEDAFTYGAWKRQNPLYGPLWQTAVGVVCMAVAVYLNQFRRHAGTLANPVAAASDAEPSVAGDRGPQPQWVSVSRFGPGT